MNLRGLKKEIEINNKKELKSLHNDFFNILRKEIENGFGAWLTEQENRIGFEIPDND